MSVSDSRSKLTRLNNVNSARVDKRQSSSVSAKQHPDSPKPEGADQTLKKESRKETRKKNRKSIDLNNVAKGVASLTNDLVAKVKRKLKDSDIESGPPENPYHEFSNHNQSYAEYLHVINAQYNAETVAAPPESPLASPVPVKAELILFGHVHPAQFEEEFTRCLDGLCDHKTPQNQNVGMAFVQLSNMVRSLSGQHSSDTIGACIEYVSNYLLPSLSRMFAKLSDQLTPGATLNVTVGFQQGLHDGLAMFEDVWSGLDQAASMIDPTYQSRSLFDSSGSAGYLDHQWRELDRLAVSRGATIQWWQ